jgi:hypothetical protein
LADIFVSYTSSDKDWAFWIGQELEALGHTPRLHDWEVSAGGNSGIGMDTSHDKADHVLLIITKAYIKSDYSDWQLRREQWDADGKGQNFALLVFVEEVEPPTARPIRALRAVWAQRG